MQVLAIVVFLGAIFGQINALPRNEQDLAEKIRQVINEIMEDVADPLAVKNVDIKIPSNSLISGELNISEISISGLKNFNIDTLTFDKSQSRLEYAFNFEDIITVLETELILHGLIELDHPLYIHMDLKNLKTEGYAVVAEDEKSVEDFSILITLGESDFDIKGLLNNDELSKKVSDFLTENVAKLIDEAAPVLSPIASGLIKTIINIVLKFKNN